MRKTALDSLPLLSIGVFILSTGVLLASPTASDASKNRLVSFVDSAAALVESKGEQEACVEFKQPGSQWFHGDTYVFINDMDGTIVCHPGHPDWEGQNLLSLQDSNGTFVIEEIIDAVKTSPSGWAEYMWPKPSEGRDAMKLTYVNKVESGGKTLLVCSGIYLD
ncbi:MAG: cache domain-containing protein [Gammaproteobacteria bacterium]|nr:cache domain-containing protein [Gammaproteobacteria bacterium]